MSPDGTLERTGDGGVIRFERQLAFAIDEVWDAITNPSRLAEWWLPMDADITVDLRVGGSIEFLLTGEEGTTITCEILRLDAPTLLEHTHVDPGAVMRWELAPTSTGCTLRLSHFVPDSGVAIEKCYLVGLHESLERLAPCLDGAPVAWDWNRLGEAQARYAAKGLAAPVAI